MSRVEHLSKAEHWLRELATAEPFHPEFELLARVAEKSADAVDREIVETHAADCANCRAELQDLRAYVRSSQGARQVWPRLLAWAAGAMIAIAALWFVDRADRPGDSLKALQIPKLAMSLAANERQLRGGERTLRDVGPLSPVGAMVLDDRPVFQWSGVRNGKYRVEIFDEAFHPVAASPELLTTSWTPPHALPGGRTYLWQITAVIAGETFTVPQPPAPEARFHVIDRRQALAIDALERNERPSLGLGVAYAEAGALAEAQREFSALVAANREAERARTYLATVQAHAP
ncbi:MAG TPA: hypothetical protein VEK57_14920 [Thermoanaerobaculia bacterium]|nr:hypothetical protein [Thermoanaerobaculia bacterium]